MTSRRNNPRAAIPPGPPGRPPGRRIARALMVNPWRAPRRARRQRTTADVRPVARDVDHLAAALVGIGLDEPHREVDRVRDRVVAVAPRGAARSRSAKRVGARLVADRRASRRSAPAIAGRPIPCTRRRSRRGRRRGSPSSTSLLVSASAQPCRWRRSSSSSIEPGAVGREDEFEIDRLGAARRRPEMRTDARAARQRCMAVSSRRGTRASSVTGERSWPADEPLQAAREWAKSQ